MMGDELFYKMSAAYRLALKDQMHADWPDDILKIITIPTKGEGRLLISECFCTDGFEILVAHKISSLEGKLDASLLGVPGEFCDLDLVVEKFKSSKMYHWLLNLLESEGGEVYFGRVSSLLHDNLLDDPVPYRSEVKKLVSNIYSWIELLTPHRISLIVDTPNHSQRISLIDAI